MPVSRDRYQRIADDVASYLTQTPKRLAEAWKSSNNEAAPFAAPTSQRERLDYFAPLVLNPDGTPNTQGRQHLLDQYGVSTYAQIVRAVMNTQPGTEAAVPAASDQQGVRDGR